MKLRISILICFLSTFIFRAEASHIVGGEMTYRCLGGNKYLIHLDLYRDCLNGDPVAIAQDNPVYFGVYDASNTGSVYRTDSAFFNEYFTVPVNFNNSCVNNPPATCLQRATAEIIFTLPPNTSGYYIVYQRCCRNASIINILNPGNTGATYFCQIPPQTVACNNSAVFSNYPPQVICINNPLVYDHSATDSDGDSLSYELCESYNDGAAPDNFKPLPAETSFPPPLVNYIAPFTFTKPMAGSPLISIDPATGMITGTPNLSGRFVVTVCCHEWRSGIMINTVKREFQFVVTNCSKAVVADIPQFSDEFNTYIVECRDKTVHFVNNSTGGFAWHWDFGVPGLADDTSDQFEPTFTYPDTGVYVVSLVVNRGTTCPDSINRLVKVYPFFDASFSVSGLHCPGSPLLFIDQSEATYKPVNSWAWSFGDGGTATDQNPTHTYDSGGSYTVSLVAMTAKGCADTVNQDLLIENFKPFAGNDTIIVVDEHIDFNASGGTAYLWTPATNLSANNIPNPVGFYPTVDSYTYQLYVKSEAGCEGYDTVEVRVVGQGALFVPTAFTPNGDGRNDVLRPINIGYRSMNYFRVFDRWGEMVYETSNFESGWDGTYKGQPAPIGTFFWVLDVTDRFGQQSLVKGDFELVR